MRVDGAEWVPCTPAWVHQHNVCGAAIRQVAWDGSGENPPEAIGHEHLMACGCPVLWTDALAGQLDRLQMETSENAAFTGGEPF